MKKMLFGLSIALIAVGFFSIKYFTTLLDSKGSAIIVNKSYAFNDNYEDKSKLARDVDNIFIGEVIRKTGNEEYTGNPNTQFLVRITQNIKGALLGDITINQEGGYYKEKGELYLLSYEKTPLLKENQMYLFAVTVTKKGYFEMMPKYGSTQLDNEDEKYKLIDEFRTVLEGNMGESEGGLQASSNPKKPYPSETAIENGDVVNIHGRISNLDKFDNFMKNIESGYIDRIRITSYTVEGDPIFYNLVYDGSQIQYSYDNSQDEFAGSDRGIKSTSCSDLVSKNTENGVVYNLSGCSSEVGNTFNFWSQN